MSRNDQKPDEVLLREFCDGRPAALGDLARRHEAALLGLAAGLLGGQRELACDAVQETWLRVIRFGPRFNGGSSVKTWLYRVLLSRCRELAAEQQRWRSANAEQSAAQGTERGRIALRSEPACAPTAGEAGSTDHSRVRDAVMQLGDEQQSVVLLCYHAGLTHAEAADILDIPIGTLKSRLHAGLTTLRATLSAGSVE